MSELRKQATQGGWRTRFEQWALRLRSMHQWRAGIWLVRPYQLARAEIEPFGLLRRRSRAAIL